MHLPETWPGLVAMIVLGGAMLGGAITALMLVTDRSPPLNLGLWHGRMGVAGIAILAWVAWVGDETGPTILPALALYVFAALGGITLYLLIRRKGRLPLLMVMGHGALAVTALLVLLGLALPSHAEETVHAGHAHVLTDTRTAIVLDPAERAMVLAEMRVFLENVQKITAGIAANDVRGIAADARRSGLAAQHAMPAALMGKLPMPFKQLGRDTHARFDQIALDAEQLGDPRHALSQLNDVLDNCVACHAAFRIDVSPER